MSVFEQIKTKVQGLRRQRGLTQSQVAERIGIGLRMYQRIESTGRATTENLEKIAAVLGVETTSLLGDRTYTITEQGAIPLQLLPVLNRIPAGGFLLGFNDVPVEEHIYSSVREPNAFALRVVGDSMSPKIDEGDLVVLSPEREFEDNRIYAVVTDDSAHTLKTVRKANGGYWLLPFNPSYNPELVPDVRMVKLYRVLEIVKRV